nr:phage terminase large subunit [Pseudomonadota bacterium]
GSRQLIISLPPRQLKSLIGSVALPAWLLGHNPALQIICASYGAELAEKLSRDCRAVMESPWYQELFPTRLDRTAVNELTTTAHGTRIATSVGGVLTGRGADVIIIDDPLKPDEALSDTHRERVNNWFDSTLFSRLNDKRKGTIILIMQRLHEDDLAGHLMARGGWSTLVLPAIAEHDESYSITSERGTRVVGRKAGEALHPEREDLATLSGLRRSIGEYNFAGQYQQTPAPREGGMIKRVWFKRYTKADLPERFEMVLQSWDTANKPSELSDYSVCTTWGLAGGRIYLLDVLRKKLDYPGLKRAVREQAELYRPDVVLIEDKASGTQLIQELAQEQMPGVKAYRPEAGLSKQMRLHAQTGVIENGLVFLPETAEWLELYLHELTTFPASKHDDQADSTAQALHWIKMGRKTVPNIVLYYQQLLDQQTRVIAHLGSGLQVGISPSG